MTWIVWPTLWFVCSTWLGIKLASTTEDFWSGWFWLTLLPTLFMLATRFL